MQAAAVLPPAQFWSVHHVGELFSQPLKPQIPYAHQTLTSETLQLDALLYKGVLYCIVSVEIP